ncbi:MAG: SDR family NAD(P)-dependent oxidoreductase, partial [Oceanococcaceae bacterium]
NAMSTETVLITGASSGIGLDMARQFAAEGSALILVARRTEALNTLAEELRSAHGIQVEVIGQDLAATGAVTALCAELQKRGLQVDVLVNNAGFGLRGTVVELDAQRQIDMIQVNVTALTELTRQLLPAMAQRGRGGVLNVASTAAFQPGPWMGVYYATKAYVLSLSEALYEETRGTGVKVSCLCPGATATGFAAEADMESSLLFRMGTMRSADVARAGIRGLRRGQAIVIPGLKNWLGALSVRFSPRFVVRMLVKSLQK